MEEQPKRGRGRPKGSRNKTTGESSAGGGLRDGDSQSNALASLPAPSSRLPALVSPAVSGTQRAVLEADRDRLLKSIADSAEKKCEHCTRGGDPKLEAALQSQLNGVNRMLLRISGETAPSDTNLIRSPQWSRLKAKLFDVLSKKHPKAWVDVLAIETEG